jgi:hypothetical protein
MTRPPPTLKVRFNSPQAHAWKHFQDGNVVVLPWGRGVGKSEFMILCMLLLVTQHEFRHRPRMPHPGVRIVVLMPALAQAKKSVLQRFRTKIQGDWAFLGGKLNEVDFVAKFPGGSYIQFVSQEQREFLRSLRCDVVFVDEGDDITKPTYSDVVSPWLSEPFSLRRRMVGGTPMLGRKGLLYELYDLARTGFARHFGKRATWRDAPYDVKPEHVLNERAKAERNGTLAAHLREYECDFDSAEGLVYPMFCDLHVAKPWEGVEPTEVIVGMDHGWEDPGVILVGHVYGSGREAVIHLVEEVYEPHRDPTWWGEKCRDVATRYPRAHWYADPSRQDLIALYRKVSGANIVNAQNTRDDGLWAVQDRFALRLRHDGEKYARLLVAPQCRETIREIGTYRYKRDPRDRERHIDAVDDRDDHAMDALRYMVFSRFGKPTASRSDRSDFTFGD